MLDDALVITGMGCVTPLGIGVARYWEELLAGSCGIGPITRFDASKLPVRIAAEIRDFDPESYFEKSVVRGTSLFMQFGLVAAKEALAMSGLEPASSPERVGIVFGTALSAIAEISQTGQHYLESKTKKIQPHFIPSVCNNMGAAQASILFGIKGPSLTVQTACSAGGDAIMVAVMLIRSHLCDAVLVLGGDSLDCDIAISSLAQAKALSRANETPEKASRPFDALRDGFVVGEGGGALVLETARSALSRSAKPLAYLAGCGNTCDGYHITAPHPEGEGAARCMRHALAMAGIEPSAIGYINAHGTSTVLGDIAETKAVKRVFGEHVPPMSSTKGATGHLLGAGGITEVIACVQSIRAGMLPPTINYEVPDPECDLDYIPVQARKASITYAMSNALGFGGQNSSVIVKRYESAE
ncbi:MAG: beta-ketoacyl-ACP synthase II [Desulfovibrionaceae bacterium]|nr:beta-ketoacyl-ACP synthase II [Desulfovibrionaceae bacterium]